MNQTMPEAPTIKVLAPLPRMANPPVVNMASMKKDYKQVVVYGKGGVGKTDFGLRSTPQPIEYIDADHRANIMSKFFDGRVSNLYQPNTQEELENCIAHAIYNLQDHFKKTGKKGTILLDSYSAAKNMVSIDYLIRQNRPLDSKLTIEDRSNIKKVMLRIINNLKYSELNLVVSAEEGVRIIGEEDKNNGKKRIAAVLGEVPKHEDDLMYFCDYLLWLYPEDVKVDGTEKYVRRYFWKLYKSSTSRIPQELTLAPKEDIDWAKMNEELDALQRVEAKKIQPVTQQQTAR